LTKLRSFGASAPYQKLAEYFGFTAEALAKRVREHLAG
jgi:transketolase